MTQLNQNITVYRGNDRIVQVTVTDGAGAAKNLTDAIIRYYVADDRDATPVITKTTASGITVISAVGGVFQATVSEAETDLERGNYQHWCDITDSEGLTHTVLIGKFTIA